MSEQALQSAILRTLGSRPDVRLFRNQGGIAWFGRPSVLSPREVLLTDFRRVTSGLATGAADLIGVQAVKITPDMVGQTIGRFVSIEIKAQRGRMTPEQQAWLAMVQRMGGYAVCARSLDDVDLGQTNAK